MAADKHSHTILTVFWLKPIPFRLYDWEAITSDYEPGHPIGLGATEADAVRNLQEQLWERGEIDEFPGLPIPTVYPPMPSCAPPREAQSDEQQLGGNHGR